MAKSELLAPQSKAKELRQFVDAFQESTFIDKSGHADLPLTDSDPLDGEAAGLEPTAPADNVGSAELVVNNNPGGKLHAIKYGRLELQPGHWQTICGWKFSRDTANSSRTSDYLCRAMCPACCKIDAKRRDSAGSEQDGSSSSVQLPRIHSLQFNTIHSLFSTQGSAPTTPSFTCVHTCG